MEKTQPAFPFVTNTSQVFQIIELGFNGKGGFVPVGKILLISVIAIAAVVFLVAYIRCRRSGDCDRIW
jgi:hypothetical protein